MDLVDLSEMSFYYFLLKDLCCTQRGEMREDIHALYHRQFTKINQPPILLVLILLKQIGICPLPFVFDPQLATVKQTLVKESGILILCLTSQIVLCHSTR